MPLAHKLKCRVAVLRYLACAAVFVVGTASAVDFDQYPQSQALVDELVNDHGMDREWVETLIRDAVYKDDIVKAISRPAEKKFPWHRYRRLFLTESNIKLGVKFWNKYHEVIERAQTQFGVDGSVIVAIIGVETRYGQVTGRHRVIDSLVTLTLGYPRRSEFFKSELVAFLQLANEENVNPLTAKGSYAGAMGVPQFISSSYRHYAVDFNGNGLRDLIGETEDAIGSVANYLKEHGWQKQGKLYAEIKADNESVLQDALTSRLNNDRKYSELKQAGIKLQSDTEPSPDDNFGVMKFEVSPGKFSYRVGYPNFFVITKYNRSTLYAMAVTELAQSLSKARAGDKN